MLRQVTLALLKPDLVMHRHRLANVYNIIHSNDFYILRHQPFQWTKEEAGQFYADHKGKFFFDRLVAYMSSGPSIAMVLGRDDAIHVWRSLMGKTFTYRTHVQQPETIRGLFGMTDTRNSAHGSDSVLSVEKELPLLFPDDTYQSLHQQYTQHILDPKAEQMVSSVSRNSNTTQIESIINIGKTYQ
eukprot:m.10150 g.10150  ORF g.10150 m.10150 type:complete len:186 (+) comp3621_c0_seq1:45-602(+)